MGLKSALLMWEVEEVEEETAKEEPADFPVEQPEEN